MDDPLASSDAAVLAVLDPGIGTSSVSVRQNGREVARFEANGGLSRVHELLDLAAGAFDVDEWFVLDAGPFGRAVVDEACRSWGFHLTLVVHDPLEPWGPGLDVEASFPSGWPDRLDLHSWRELWSWLRGVFRWRVA